jgi:hypothetical protein
MFAFLSLLFVLIVIFLFTVPHADGFKNMTAATPSEVTIPAVPSAPSPDPKEDSPVSPHTLPGELPVAPYGAIASTNPLPYQDTTLIKANRQQIVSLLEMLKGFLAFEAQELTERSDPSIQLPLSNARSDFQILQNAVDLLNRNPGLQPTMSLTTLNEMSSNLAYLQEQGRLTGSAGALYKEEGFQNQNDVASVDDLTKFVSRIQGEILRLSASGTTDPNVQARVAALTNLKNDIQGIIGKVNNKTMSASEIPVKKSELEKSFPILGKLNEPLPQLVRSVGLPAGFANMLPSSLQKDPETVQQVRTLIDNYADQFMKGVTATFNVTYTAPANEEKHRAKASTIDKTGFPSQADLNNVTNAKFMPADSGNIVTDLLAPKPSDAGRGPSHFDWRQRAKEIEAQIQKRGLNATDYGIMPQGTKTSDDFSWKGYTRMICTRLQATPDPALGITCGCPPMDWKGWRISK